MKRGLMRNDVFSVLDTCYLSEFRGLWYDMPLFWCSHIGHREVRFRDVG